MGRTCAVDGCATGRSSDVRQRKLLGLKTLSIFNAPKKDDVRKKWSEALNISLKLGNRICELHFHDRHIKRKDVTIMPDGTLEIIPLDHVFLIDGAIPTLNPEKGDDEKVNEKTTRTEIKVVDEDVTSTDIKPPSSSVECIPSVPLVGTESECTQPIISAIEEEENRPESEPLADVSVPEEHVFNENDLLQGFSVTPLPKAWSWMRDFAGRFTLVRLDLTTWKPILYTKINADMSITCCAPDGGQSLDLGTTVSNMDDILDMIQMVDHQKLCVGTGMTNESRAPECLVILENSECPKNFPEPRCKYCRRSRRRLQNQMRRPKVDYQTKYLEVRQKLDLLQWQLRRTPAKVPTNKKKTIARIDVENVDQRNKRRESKHVCKVMHLQYKKKTNRPFLGPPNKSNVLINSGSISRVENY